MSGIPKAQQVSKKGMTEEMDDETKQVSIITTAIVIVVGIIVFNVRGCGEKTELAHTAADQKVLSDCVEHGNDPLACKAMLEHR